MLNRTRKNIVILLVNGIFLSLSLRCAFAVAFTAQGEQIEKSVQPQAAAGELEVITRPQVEYTADSLRDPFEGYKQEMNQETIQDNLTGTPMPTLNITGLIWGSVISQAIINDKVVRVGDTIEGVKILAIDKDGVKVSFSGRPYQLLPPAASMVNSEAQTDYQQ